jgi:glycosyltransferase involved in cell wall biosynthesis
MRIALIHTRLLYRGGLESRLIAYMRYLQAQGHAVTVCVYKQDPAVEVPKGVAVKRFRLRWLPKMLRAWFFNRSLARYFAKEKFDLRISLGRTTCHDAMIVAGNHLAFLQAMGRKPRGLDDRIQVKLDGLSYAAPGILLPASEMLRDQMLAFHAVDASKVHVLYPPTDGKRFHSGLKAQKSEFRQRFGFGDGKRSFLLISANHALKGLPILMQVFAQLQNLPIELLVAGGKPFEPTSNVRHLGFVRETEQLYAAGDFTVLASRYDAFGQVVTESLLCGTPVIVSGMTGAKAIVGPGEGIVVDSFEVADWKAAILAALETEFHIDPALAAHKGLLFEDHMARLLACAGAGRPAS